MSSSSPSSQSKNDGTVRLLCGMVEEVIECRMHYFNGLHISMSISSKYLKSMLLERSIKLMKNADLFTHIHESDCCIYLRFKFPNTPTFSTSHGTVVSFSKSFSTPAYLGDSIVEKIWKLWMWNGLIWMWNTELQLVSLWWDGMQYFLTARQFNLTRILPCLGSMASNYQLLSDYDYNAAFGKSDQDLEISIER